MPDDLGAGVALLNEGVELTAADLDDGQLRGDEKTVEEDQGKNSQQPEEDDLSGFPMSGRKMFGFPCRHGQNGSDERHGKTQLARQVWAMDALMPPVNTKDWMTERRFLGEFFLESVPVISV